MTPAYVAATQLMSAISAFDGLRVEKSEPERRYDKSDKCVSTFTEGSKPIGPMVIVGLEPGRLMAGKGLTRGEIDAIRKRASEIGGALEVPAYTRRGADRLYVVFAETPPSEYTLAKVLVPATSQAVVGAAAPATRRTTPGAVPLAVAVGLALGISAALERSA